MEAIWELGMIGLGKISANMARRLSMSGHQVVGYDRRPEPVQELEIDGVTGAASMAEL